MVWRRILFALVEWWALLAIVATAGLALAMWFQRLGTGKDDERAR